MPTIFDTMTRNPRLAQPRFRAAPSAPAPMKEWATRVVEKVRVASYGGLQKGSESCVRDERMVCVHRLTMSGPNGCLQHPLALTATNSWLEEPVMATRLSTKIREWINVNQGLHFCQCGCGQAIRLIAHHYYEGVPGFLIGHNLNPYRSVAERFWRYVQKDRKSVV